MHRLNLLGRVIRNQIELVATVTPAHCDYAHFASQALLILLHMCLTAGGLLINVRPNPGRKLQPVAESKHLIGSPDYQIICTYSLEES